MIRLLFVGDGPRDHASIPPLVGTILAKSIDPTSDFRDWGSIRARGFPKQIRYFIRAAKARGLSGVVAVVDADIAPARSRLKKLREGRELDRNSNAPFPCALGEANPHVDAWLLDDAHAVRTALELDKNSEVSSASKVEEAKAELNKLITSSPKFAASTSDNQSTLPFLAKIARAVEPKRCTHAKETGLEAFQKEVQSELGPLTR